MRLILLLVTIRRKKGVRSTRQLALHDVSVAFSHATAREKMAIILPRDETHVPDSHGGDMEAALYGTREAS